MTLLLIYLFLALFVSALCSIMESVLLTTPISFLKVKEDKGHHAATKMIDLKNNIDRPLSAILSLNTIAHTIGAAGVGAQATIVFGEAYFGLVSACLTIMILVFTEIIPKTVGARFWRELALVSGSIIRIMIVVTYPLVVLSSMITKIVSKNKSSVSMSRDEISAIANMGAESGAVEHKENKIIQNLIRLKKVKVEEIMTPRVVVEIADENTSLQEFRADQRFLHFSRIPVYKDNPDNITGYVFRLDAFENKEIVNDEHTLNTIKRNIVFVPVSNHVFSIWEILLEKKEHIALVVDEYGGIAGIVTMEDIIETVTGSEIIDEKDKVTDMQKYARERWEKRKKKYNLMKEFFHHNK